MLFTSLIGAGNESRLLSSSKQRWTPLAAPLFNIAFESSHAVVPVYSILLKASMWRGMLKCSTTLSL